MSIVPNTSQQYGGPMFPSHNTGNAVMETSTNHGQPTAEEMKDPMVQHKYYKNLDADSDIFFPQGGGGA